LLHATKADGSKNWLVLIALNHFQTEATHPEFLREFAGLLADDDIF